MVVPYTELFQLAFYWLTVWPNWLKHVNVQLRIMRSFQHFHRKWRNLDSKLSLFSLLGWSSQCFLTCFKTAVSKSDRFHFQKLRMWTFEPPIPTKSKLNWLNIWKFSFNFSLICYLPLNSFSLNTLTICLTFFTWAWFFGINNFWATPRQYTWRDPLDLCVWMALFATLGVFILKIWIDPNQTWRFFPGFIVSSLYFNLLY